MIVAPAPKNSMKDERLPADELRYRRDNPTARAAVPGIRPLEEQVPDETGAMMAPGG
jgi:hypothetical protein